MEFEIKDPLIAGLMKHIAAPKFQSTFEAFFLENALKFDDDDEQKLEYMELYKEFQAMFDEAMAGIARNIHFHNIKSSSRRRT